MLMYLNHLVLFSISKIIPKMCRNKFHRLYHKYYLPGLEAYYLSFKWLKKWIPCVNSCYFCPICERIKGKLQTYIQLAHTLHIGKPSFIDCGKNGSWCLFSSSSHAEESSEKKISTVIGIALLLWHATHKTRKWSWYTGLSKFLKNLLKIYY